MFLDLFKIDMAVFLCFVEVLWGQIFEKLTGYVRDGGVCRRCQKAQCSRQKMGLWKSRRCGWAGSPLRLRSDHLAWALKCCGPAFSCSVDSVQGRWAQVLTWGWTGATLYTSKERKSSSFLVTHHHFISKLVYKLGLDELAVFC